jgi:hypothetical protein
MSQLYPGAKASRARRREAATARENRREIVKALSQGQVSRRDLLKWGLFTSAGMLAPVRGLNPFVSSAYAASSSDIPTGIPASPLGDVKPSRSRCCGSTCCRGAPSCSATGTGPARSRRIQPRRPMSRSSC